MDEHPTHVRHRVIAVCSVMAVLLYLDRFCVSFAEVFIKEDLRLTTYDISLMFGAFFLSYALGQTPAGWLADRFGGRRMLTLFIFSWSLFTALLGIASGIWMLIVLRIGMGFAQAGAFPTAASMISKWVPVTKRGTASSLVALGGRLGGALSLFITPFVILYFVPVEIDSQLTRDDLLRPDLLARQLSASRPSDASPTSQLSARVWESFSTESRRVLEESVDPTASYPPGEDDAAASTPQADVLVAELNGIVTNRDFFRTGQLGDLKLEREAATLLAAERASLSQPQVERLNRLVLEAIFPKQLKQVYGAGWRKMTLFYGLIGIPVALLFWSICRDDPRKHPRVNEAELALIEEGRPPPSAAAEVRHLPLREIALSRSMWFNGAMQFFTNVGWVFFMTYLPRYLIEIHQVPVSDRAWMSTTPTVVAILGMFLGGFLADRMIGPFGRRWGRSLPIALTRFAAAASYLLCLMDISPWTAVALLSAANFFCDLGIPAVWAFQQDMGGKHTGSVLGWGNMWGNFGAAVGPLLLVWIAGEQQNWSVVFVVCAAAFVISGLLALGIDSTRKVIPE